MAYKSVMAMMLIDKVSPAYKAMGKNATKFSMIQHTAMKSANHDVKNMMATAKGYVFGRGLVGGFNMVKEGIRGMSQEWVLFDENTHFAASKWQEIKEGTLTFNEALRETKKISRDVGSQTKFTAGDVAGAMDVMAMSGYKLSQSNADIMLGVAKFATLARSEMPEATTSITGAMAAWGVGIEHINSFGDKMTNTFTRSRMSLDELAEATKKAGIKFRLAGQDISVFNAMAMQLAKFEIRGEEAGTKLRNIMIRLTAKKTQKGLRGLGVNVFDEKGSYRNMIDILGDMSTKLADLTPKQKAMRFNELFNMRDAVAAEAILDGVGGSLDAFYTMQGEHANAMSEQYARVQGSAANLAAILKSTFTEKIFGSIEGVRNPLTDMLSDMIEKVKGFDMRGVNEWLAVTIPQTITFIGETLKALWPDIKATAKVVGSLITTLLKISPIVLPIVEALIPLTLAFVALEFAVKGVVGIMNLFTGIKFFSGVILANPWWLLATALIAVVGVMILVANNWDKWGESITATWEKVAHFFDIVFNGFSLMIDFFINVMNRWGEVKQAFADGGILSALAVIGSAFKDSVLDQIDRTRDRLLTFLTVAKNGLLGLGKILISTMVAPLELMLSVMHKIGLLWSDDWYDRFQRSTNLSMASVRGKRLSDKQKEDLGSTTFQKNGYSSDGGLSSMIKGGFSPFTSGVPAPNSSMVQHEQNKSSEITLKLEGMNASLVKEAIIDGKSFQGMDLGIQSSGEGA